MRIAVAGGGLLASKLLDAIHPTKHEVVGILLNGRTAKGLRRLVARWTPRFLVPKTHPLHYAKQHGLPLVFIDKMDEVELAPLRELNPDLLLVGGFSIILKRPLIELPRLGCLNTHSSLLPRHRGPNPFSAAILSGDEETGVTFHIIDPGIDTGDIVAQYRLPIKPTACAVELHRKCAVLAGEHIVEVLEKIDAEGLHGTPQDCSLATYEKSMTKEQATIDWSQTAAEIGRHVRACVPTCMARFPYKGRTVFIYAASPDPEPVPEEAGTVVEAFPKVKIATGEGTVTVKAAFRSKPFPWVWPGVFDRPKPGERLE